MATSPNSCQAQQAALPDDPSAEEYAEFRARMGRWRKQAIAAVLNPVFWLTVQVMHKARAPLDHHFAFVRQSNTTNVMAEMVCGKADTILGELSDLVGAKAATWCQSLVMALGDEEFSLPSDVGLANVLELGATLVFHHHAAYFRRIVQDLKRLPLTLLWFGHSDPTTPCPTRMRLAQRILAENPMTLEANARKLRALCLEDLEVCAHDGTVGPHLFAIARSWVATAKSDVAINEGHNSLIKAIAQRCRNIGLPLLSSRANCKKELKVGVRGAPLKWSGVKHGALAMVQDRAMPCGFMWAA